MMFEVEYHSNQAVLPKFNTTGKPTLVELLKEPSIKAVYANKEELKAIYEMDPSLHDDRRWDGKGIVRFGGESAMKAFNAFIKALESGVTGS